MVKKMVSEYRCDNCKNDDCPIWISSNRLLAQNNDTYKMGPSMKTVVAVVTYTGCTFHSNILTIIPKPEKPVTQNINENRFSDMDPLLEED